MPNGSFVTDTMKGLGSGARHVAAHLNERMDDGGAATDAVCCHGWQMGLPSSAY